MGPCINMAVSHPYRRAPGAALTILVLGRIHSHFICGREKGYICNSSRFSLVNEERFPLLCLPVTTWKTWITLKAHLTLRKTSSLWGTEENFSVNVNFLSFDFKSSCVAIYRLSSSTDCYLQERWNFRFSALRADLLVIPEFIKHKSNRAWWRSVHTFEVTFSISLVLCWWKYFRN